MRLKKSLPKNTSFTLVGNKSGRIGGFQIVEISVTEADLITNCNKRQTLEAHKKRTLSLSLRQSSRLRRSNSFKRSSYEAELLRVNLVARL